MFLSFAEILSVLAVKNVYKGYQLVEEIGGVSEKLMKEPVHEITPSHTEKPFQQKEISLENPITSELILIALCGILVYIFALFVRKLQLPENLADQRFIEQNRDFEGRIVHWAKKSKTLE